MATRHLRSSENPRDSLETHVAEEELGGLSGARESGVVKKQQEANDFGSLFRVHSVQYGLELLLADDVFALQL